MIGGGISKVVVQLSPAVCRVVCVNRPALGTAMSILEARCIAVLPRTPRARTTPPDLKIRCSLCHHQACLGGIQLVLSLLPLLCAHLKQARVQTVQCPNVVGVASRRQISSEDLCT
jgi:hypothetical protein